MSNREIVRAWKDPQFRATLGGAMPDHPAGQIHFACRGLNRNTGIEPLSITTIGCITSRCTHGSTHAHCCG